MRELTDEEQCVLIALLKDKRVQWATMIANRAMAFGKDYGYGYLSTAGVHGAILELEWDGLIRRALIGESFTGPYELTYEGWILANEIYGLIEKGGRAWGI